MKATSTICLLAWSLVACGDKAADPMADPAPTPDVLQEPEAPAPQPDASPDPKPPAYAVERSLPPTSDLEAPRGLTLMRGIIHLHTIHSHDACDGQPRLEMGEPNLPCHADWLEGVCTTRQDVVFNTDHETHAAFEDFETLLLAAEGDEILMEEGTPTAARLRCPDGHRVTVMPGGEFGVMPVGLKGHLPGTPEQRDALYSEVTPERVDSFKALGAVVLQAHTESRDIDLLRSLDLDGFEIYNLHANIDPNIREEFLGLEALGFTQGVAPFLARGGPAPDLVLLGFLEESRPALRAFDVLLAEGHHLVGTAGTDAHRNSLPFRMPDGERTDSYRRMLRFFSHHLLVEGQPSPEALRDSLRSGRVFVVFEALGTPTGLDYRAEAGDDIAEMGAEVALADAPTLKLDRPRVHGFDGHLPTTLRILRATSEGAVEVAASNAETLAFTPTEPGAYRAEIRLRPEHLRAALAGSADDLIKETIWVYANPIYVR